MRYPTITEKIKKNIHIHTHRERERERRMQQSCSIAINQICKPPLRNSTNWKTKKDSKKKLTNHKQYSTVWQI
jgi:hypothetical protein